MVKILVYADWKGMKGPQALGIHHLLPYAACIAT